MDARLIVEDHPLTLGGTTLTLQSAYRVYPFSRRSRWLKRSR